MASMVRRLGQKLIQGAKEEIGKEPIQILNTEKVLEWAEIAIPVLILLTAMTKGFRKSPQPLTIVINNYIPGVK